MKMKTVLTIVRIFMVLVGAACSAYVIFVGVSGLMNNWPNQPIYFKLIMAGGVIAVVIIALAVATVVTEPSASDEDEPPEGG